MSKPEDFVNKTSLDMAVEYFGESPLGKDALVQLAQMKEKIRNLEYEADLNCKAFQNEERNTEQLRAELAKYKMHAGRWRTFAEKAHKELEEARPLIEALANSKVLSSTHIRL